MINNLKNNGVAELTAPFKKDVVKSWNARIDPIMDAARKEERAYASAWDLHKAGVLEEIFTPEIKRAIKEISANAVIYHCHVYEIAANRRASHVHSGALAGWHADDESAPYYRNGDLGFVSMFIHMTDVASPENGAFEIRPTQPSVPLGHGQESIQMLGEEGATFFFHRSFFHRASPNLSDVRRRVFKLSIQDRGLLHERIGLDEYKKVAEAMKDRDAFLAHLFDTENEDPQAMLPEVANADALESFVPTPNSTVSLPPVGRLKTMFGGPRLAA